MLIMILFIAAAAIPVILYYVSRKRLADENIEKHAAGKVLLVICIVFDMLLYLYGFIRFHKPVFIVLLIISALFWIFYFCVFIYRVKVNDLFMGMLKVFGYIISIVNGLFLDFILFVSMASLMM